MEWGWVFCYFYFYFLHVVGVDCDFVAHGSQEAMSLGNGEFDPLENAEPRDQVRVPFIHPRIGFDDLPHLGEDLRIVFRVRVDVGLAHVQVLVYRNPIERHHVASLWR